MLDSHIIDTIVKMKLELVGLREHADKIPAQISGGMKKRAGLARALALDPQVLFYDEPSAGLDPITAAEIDRLVLRLKKAFDVTLVVVTHELGFAYHVAKRVLFLHDGIIHEEGTPDEVLKHPGKERTKAFLAGFTDFNF